MLLNQRDFGKLRRLQVGSTATTALHTVQELSIKIGPPGVRRAINHQSENSLYLEGSSRREEWNELLKVNLASQRESLMVTTTYPGIIKGNKETTKIHHILLDTGFSNIIFYIHYLNFVVGYNLL